MDRIIYYIKIFFEIVITIFKVITNVVLGYIGIGLLLILPLIGWSGYEYYTYRFVIDGQYNVISDQKTPYHLIANGQSMVIIDNIIYAYRTGLFLVIDQSNNNIKVYVDNQIDFEFYMKLKREFYGDLITIASIESIALSDRDYEQYLRLKNIKTNFPRQGVKFVL